MGVPTINEWWPEYQIDLLQMMWIAGSTASEIAEKLGKSRNSVIGKAHRLHLASRPRPLDWSKCETDILREMLTVDKKPSDISNKLGRTRHAVRHKIIRLGLNTRAQKTPPLEGDIT